jgi:hypothetical protein
MLPSIIFIRTKDLEFSKALEDLTMDGVHRGHVVRPAEQADWGQVIQHIVKFTAEHGPDSFFAWLLSQLKKKTPRETTINKREIPSGEIAITEFLETIKNEIKNNRDSQGKP